MHTYVLCLLVYWPSSHPLDQKLTRAGPPHAAFTAVPTRFCTVPGTKYTLNKYLVKKWMREGRRTEKKEGNKNWRKIGRWALNIFFLKNMEGNLQSAFLVFLRVTMPRVDMKCTTGFPPVKYEPTRQANGWYTWTVYTRVVSVCEEVNALGHRPPGPDE